MFEMGVFGGLAPFFLSLKVMLASGVLLFVIGLPLALVLSRPGWPGRSLIKALVSLPLIFPPIALGFFGYPIFVIETGSEFTVFDHLDQC